MKKWLSILLVVTLVTALLAGCGGSSSKASDVSSQQQAATEESANTPAEEEPAEAAEGSNVSFEPMTLTVSLQAQEIEVAGIIFKEFQEYVSEKTGGAVTFNVNYGGTIASAFEELELCGSGAIDMCILAQPMYSENLPLLNFPSQMKGDPETIIEFANYMLFDNEDTATLIQEEAASYNVMYLNACFTGNCAFCAVDPFESLDDLAGRKIGNMDTTKFSGIGLTAITCMPDETYESLERGVIDASQMAIDGIYTLGWYEVAPYIMYDGLGAFGGPYTINIDTWNSMSSELQKIIADGAMMAEDLYAEMVIAQQDSWQADMEDAGAVFGTLSEEDQLTWVQAVVDVNFAAQMEIAEKQGIADKEQVIQDAIVEFFDYLQ